MTTSSSSRWQGRAAISLLIGLGVIGGITTGWMSPAAAQTRPDTLSLIVPPVLQMDPGSEVLLPLQITPSNLTPRRAMVLIRGLPASMTLSEGRKFESGLWSVNVADLGRLKIRSPDGAGGRTDLNISIVTMDGVLLAETQSTLLVGGTQTATQPARTDPTDNAVFTAAPQAVFRQEIARQPQSSAPTLRSLTPEAKAQLAQLMKKGDEDMRTGNVANARLIYKHVAEGGMAAGALAMAATYDEAELSRLKVRGGLQADAKEARAWYEKARELGAPEAQERLERLGAR